MLLIVTYGLGLLFSLKTHREFFGSVRQIGFECGYRAGKRVANRAIRRTRARFGQLSRRSDADEFAILARRGGNDAYFDYDGISSDQRRPFGVVCRGASHNRVHDFRFDAILATTAGLGERHRLRSSLNYTRRRAAPGVRAAPRTRIELFIGHRLDAAEGLDLHFLRHKQRAYLELLRDLGVFCTLFMKA